MEWLLILVVLYIGFGVALTLLARDGEINEVAGWIASGVFVLLVISGFAIKILGPVIERVGILPLTVLVIGMALVYIVAPRVGTWIGTWIGRHVVLAVCVGGLAFAAISVAYVLLSGG
jgi:hypothetical protein